jgi:hypothetical protein
MSEYPSLIIFPTSSKSESRRFPSKMPINSTNVLGFVLANLSRSHRLLGLVMACNYKVNLPSSRLPYLHLNPLSSLSQRQNSTNDCITTIQEEITESISFMLREWRKRPHRRAAILRIIKQLKQIYLKLFAIKSSCDFLEVDQEVRRLIERWQKSLGL